MATIKNMHYDFKQKLNRLDTNTYQGLKIPQIDWQLNQAMLLYILLIAEPRIKNQLGFESSQRSIDDILPIVLNGISLTRVGQTDDEGFVYALPQLYMFYISTSVLKMSLGECQEQDFTTSVIRHNDENERRDFYKSNFDWRSCNIKFINAGVIVYPPEGATIDRFSINYIRTPLYMHNAEDYGRAGVYNLPDTDAVQLSGHQDCMLPVHTHAEIVDLAVMLTTGSLQLPVGNQMINNVLRTKQLINN